MKRNVKRNSKAKFKRNCKRIFEGTLEVSVKDCKMDFGANLKEDH